MCRSAERAQDGVSELKNTASQENVDRVGELNYKRNQRQRQDNYSNGKRDFFTTCKFCLRKHQFGRERCPAWGQKCRDCSSLNHFAKSVVCRKGELCNDNSTEQRDHLAGALFLGSVEAECAKVARIKSASDNNEWEIELKAK